MDSLQITLEALNTTLKHMSELRDKQDEAMGKRLDAIDRKLDTITSSEKVSLEAAYRHKVDILWKGATVLISTVALAIIAGVLHLLGLPK